MTDDFYLSTGHDEVVKGRKGWPDLDVRAAGRRNGLRLRGLSASNQEAMERGVVMHEAFYNEGEVMGRSYGCPAFRPGEGSPVLEQIADGGLFYGYAPVCEAQMEAPLAQVKGWESICE